LSKRTSVVVPCRLQRTTQGALFWTGGGGTTTNLKNPNCCTRMASHRLSLRTVAVRHSDRHGKHWLCTSKCAMKRLLFLVSIASLLFLGNASAAGPYDGEWSGSATSKDSRCKSASVTLTILGNQATGQAKFDPDARNIHGTVRPDGTFGGTIGFQHLTGKIVDDTFEATFQNPDCVWMLIVKHTRPQSPASRTPSPRRLPPGFALAAIAMP
jgi:hypothetical protein